MEEITKILPGEAAGRIQATAADYDCQIVELGVVGNGNVRLTLKGDSSNLQALIKSIEQ